MKFSLAILASVATATQAQWHKCGSKPQKAWKGRSVKCSGDTCHSVCKKGWQSEGLNQIQCVSDGSGGYSWSATEFSQCVTCDTVTESALGAGVNMQTIYRRNYQKVLKFFCGDETDTFNFKGEDFTGQDYRFAKCVCRKGQGSDPDWKTSCAWEHKSVPFLVTEAYAATCTTNQPDNTQLDLDNGVLDDANDQDSLDQNDA